MIVWLFLLAFASAYVKLNFTVHTGNSVSDNGPNRQIEVHARDDGLELQNMNTFYAVDIEVGSNKQKIKTLLDTGSADLWVPLSLCDSLSNNKRKRSLGRKRGKMLSKRYFGVFEELKELEDLEDFHEKEVSKASSECKQYGTFAPDDLSTFKENTTAPGFYIQYADFSVASGYWGEDTVSWGDYSVTLPFGVAESADMQSIFGIGFPAGESLNSYRAADPNRPLWTYSNFPMLLKEQGLTKSWAYSLLLGANNASEGEILFGAVDHGKYEGLLQKVKVVNTYGKVNVPVFRFDVILDGVLSDNFEFKDQTTVLLDSGATLLKLPYLYLSALREKYDLRTSSSLDSMYEIDCSYLQLTETLSFHLSGIEISVPLRDLVYRYYKCYFGIKPDAVTYTLGANFLESAYVVYDMQNQEIALAQAKASPSEEKIEEFEGTIPSALEAPYYTYTDLEEFYTTANRKYTKVSQQANVAQYDFQTSGRSSYDFGSTTYPKYGSGAYSTRLALYTTNRGSTNRGSTTSDEDQGSELTLATEEYLTDPPRVSDLALYTYDDVSDLFSFSTYSYTGYDWSSWSASYNSMRLSVTAARLSRQLADSASRKSSLLANSASRKSSLLEWSVSFESLLLNYYLTASGGNLGTISAGCYGCPETDDADASTGTGTGTGGGSTSAGGMGSRNLALHVLVYQMVVFLVMWI